jgi:hypothetical protein
MKWSEHKKHWINKGIFLGVMLAAAVALFYGCRSAAAENPFNHDWSTNSPGAHIKLSWDLGSEYNQFGLPVPETTGTELWGAWYKDGFKAGPSWDDLETGAATNRFLMATVLGDATNCWVSLPPGEYFLAVYAYIYHPTNIVTYTNYDSTGTPIIVVNTNKAFNLRSTPSNILELKVPGARHNVELLSSSGVSTNLVYEDSFEVDVTGTQEKLFTLRLDFTKPVIVPLSQPPPLP